MPKPGGLSAPTLRDGSAEPGRRLYRAPSEEAERLARDDGAFIEHLGTAPDRGGRDDVRWAHLALRRRGGA